MIMDSFREKIIYPTKYKHFAERNSNYSGSSSNYASGGGDYPKVIIPTKYKLLQEYQQERTMTSRIVNETFPKVIYPTKYKHQQESYQNEERVISCGANFKPISQATSFTCSSNECNREKVIIPTKYKCYICDDLD